MGAEFKCPPLWEQSLLEALLEMKVILFNLIF
jgi:hypothetical protein